MVTFAIAPTFASLHQEPAYRQLMAQLELDVKN